MNTTEKNTKKLIKRLESESGIECLTAYTGNGKDYVFYYALTGFLNDLYFSISIYKWQNIERIRIENKTDDFHYFKGILEDHNLILTE